MDHSQKYGAFTLCREMLETAEVVENFNPAAAREFAAELRGARGAFFTGEGSSRIFPAKRTLSRLFQRGADLLLFTEGATQALEYTLNDYAVFGASNSGKTKEVVRLFSKLKTEGHQRLCGLMAHSGTPLQKLATRSHVLGCGGENAVAATKSVMEQALFYHAVFAAYYHDELGNLQKLAADLRTVLTAPVDPAVVEQAARADVLYFAGRNNGVAEELTLKANEITRKRSDFLEGTYAVHGIEEVMQKNDIVIIIDPFPSEVEKYQECLSKGVGLSIAAVASRETGFPTIRIPDHPEFAEYLQLAAGWSLLVEIGLRLGINLDRPERARKVGNEFFG